MFVDNEKKLSAFSKYITYIVLLIATLIIVFNNMVISPQYEMVYSQYNQSIFYLIGKLMKSGKTLYVDMIDHKGVYIFLLHYLAEIICETKHIGLYIVGSIFIFVTSLYIYKLLILILANDNEKNFYSQIIALLLSIVAIVMQTLYSISYGELQCETFVLTALVISIYYFCKSVANGNYSYKTTLLYGIMFSFIVFIKANYAIVFLCFAVHILISELKEKNGNAVTKHFIYGIIGVIIGMLPGIIYCMHKGIIPEMIHNTFTVNILYSNMPYFGLSSRLASIAYTLNAFKFYFIVIIIGFIIVLKIYRTANINIVKCIKCLFVITLILMFALLYSARDYEYYLLILIPSVVVIVSGIFKLILVMTSKINSKILLHLLNSLFVLVVSIIVLLVNSNYGKALMIKNGESQLKIARSIKNAFMNDRSYAINTNNDIYDFYVLGTNLYLYDYMGKLPSFKYFCIPIIEYKYYSEPYTETFEYIKNGNARYVVVGNGRTLTELFKNTGMEIALNEKYSSISFNKGISALVRKR